MIGFGIGAIFSLMALAAALVYPLGTVYVLAGGVVGFLLSTSLELTTGLSLILIVIGLFAGLALYHELHLNDKKPIKAAKKTVQKPKPVQLNHFFTKEETTMKSFILSSIEPRDHEINKCLDLKESFDVSGVDKAQAVRVLEALIESKGMTCRVYTENRAAVMSAALIPTGITQLTGLATAVGVGVHNLLTLNPDYEIGKHPLENKVTVTYKKS